MSNIEMLKIIDKFFLEESKEKLKDIITDRLLRMGLIGQPVKKHDRAIELLVQDVEQYIASLQVTK